MLSEESYNTHDSELVAERTRAHRLCASYNLSPTDSTIRSTLLSNLLGKVGEDSEIEAPFHCDFGYNISLGSNVFLNFNCIILDCGTVTIGDGVKLGPGVQLYTVGHPIDPTERKRGLEFAHPIVIEENVWIGGGSIVLPGITIGRNAVIGAGSIVTKDIPANVVAAGNPCRVIRQVPH